jgi:murein DD-endopeptidase MepM/ murein hydrolase activator NlpD
MATRLARVLYLLMVLAAGVACVGGTTPPARDVSRGLDSQDAPVGDIPLVPDTMVVSGFVPQRTTLDVILRGHGVADDAVADVIAAARTVFDPRRLRSLQPFSIERTIEGALRVFEYEIDANWLLRVSPASADAASLTAAVVPIPKTVEAAAVAGRIDRETPSLFQSMDAAGEGPELAVALADIFSGEVDFGSELQPGDRFAVAFEKHTREGRPAGYGDVAAAELYNNGRALKAYRFTVPGATPAYFDEQGRSLRRFFLRSPLKFEPRITSRFSASRQHPVVHTARAHRGVDYAAPYGAAVVAAAAGTVVGVTSDGTNGRMVRIRHASGYESYYLHLSAFAPGIRAGARIEQGDTLGRVGATGLATGPHLHYGLTRNGGFVNPLREQANLPPADPVPAAAMAAFLAERDRQRVLVAAALASTR